jgi:LemA protein
MKQRKMLTLFIALCLLGVVAPANAQVRTPPQTAAPQTPAPAAKQKPPSKDEVYFSIARRINTQNNTAVSGVVSALDGVIEIKEITVGADGKATVVVQERAPSNAAHTQKSSRLIFTPAGDDKWNWEQFEEARRLYAVERIFSYTQNDLGRKKQNIAAKWAAFTQAISKQNEAGIKALETAKAVLKAEPQQLSALVGIRTTLAEAAKTNDAENLANVYLNSFRDLTGQTDSIIALADSYEQLKANDAYLRLIEEFKNAVNATRGTRRDYVETVNVYNESLQRLPFALVAYGLEFQRIEPKIEAE